MRENTKNKDEKDKTIFELINDLRTDEKVFLRFLVVSMILECLIFIPLCNLIGTSYFEPFIQYICLIGIIMILAWICSLNWITLNCSKIPKWFYFISIFASMSVIFSIIIIVCSST